MRPIALASALTTIALLLAAVPAALAQDEGEPIYGQEIMTEQEQERYRARLRALASDSERLAFRDRHRVEMETRARQRGLEAPIYGQQLMTQQERQQYRERMGAFENEADRAAFREQHRAEMLARLREQRPGPPSVAAPGDAGSGDRPMVRGRELMTPEERARHREEMRSKATAEERERARHEKHEEMKQRAHDRGMTLPDTPMPRGSGGGSGGGGGGRR